MQGERCNARRVWEKSLICATSQHYSNADWCRFQKQYFLFSIKEEKLVTPSRLNLLFLSFIIIVHTLTASIFAFSLCWKAVKMKNVNWKSERDLMIPGELTREAERSISSQLLSIKLNFKMLSIPDFGFMRKEIR